MARNVLILGASYGSLLATKLLMAGHNVTLVCRQKTADLINRDGTEVRIKLRDEPEHRSIFSRDLPGKLDASPPQNVDVSRYDLVGLAMQEPQYANHTIRVLMIKIAEAKLPCLSIMNMPPLPYLKRIPALEEMDLEEAYTNASGVGALQAGPDLALLARPAGFPPAGRGRERASRRPADELQGRDLRGRGAQRAAARTGSRHRRGAAGRPGSAGEAQGVRLAVRAARQVVDAADRKLSLHHARTSRSRSATRCTAISTLSRSIYEHVDGVARRLGADPKDQVPFEKYAKAAESLLKPSSAARAVANGAPFIERVDLLVKLISHQLGVPNAEIDHTVQTVDGRLNETVVPG